MPRSMERKKYANFLIAFEKYLITILRVGNERGGKYKGDDNVADARHDLLTQMDSMGMFDDEDDGEKGQD